MNIFVTDESPQISANNLDDKRVIKMITESTQLLSTAVNQLAGKQVAPYRSTHANHPCTIWTQQSVGNYIWLFDHAARLCTIYRENYGRIHKCQEYLNILSNDGIIKYLPKGGLKNFANCASNKQYGLDFRDIEDVPKAYKLYLVRRWKLDKRTPTWKGRQRPEWSDELYRK